MLESYDEMTWANGWQIRYRRMKGANVRHKQTCTVCGRKLVNTYRRDGVWKCKKCWDREGGATE